MKIAFVELDTHAEVLQSFLALSSRINHLELSVFVSEKIKNRLPETYHHRLKVCRPKDLPHLLSQQRWDLVIIGTMHRYFNIFYPISQRHPCVAIAHNLNFHTASIPQIIARIWQKEQVYRLKLIFKEGLWLKNKLRQNLKTTLVLDENIAQNYKKTMFLPLFFKKNNQEKNNQKISVVIPGTVEQSRRDYEHVLEQIAHYHGPKIELVFLGKADAFWAERLAGLKPNAQVHLIYFVEKVPPLLFDEYMKKASILWCPIQDKTYFMGIAEYYGQSKCSGNIGDAISYGQVAVFPKHYAGQAAFIYKTHDLDELIAIASERIRVDFPSLEKRVLELAQTLDELKKRLV